MPDSSALIGSWRMDTWTRTSITTGETTDASYTLEEDRVVHHVDASWNPNWQGMLSRPFTLKGDRLIISGAPGIDPTTGEEVVYRMEFTKA